MTADRRAALVEKVRDLVNFFCDTPCGDGEYCGCRKDAEKAIDLIRAEVLEEAARVADQAEATDRQAAREPNDAEELAAFMRGAFKSRNIAAAIRALKEK